MQITDVKIRKTFTEGPMLAVASITLEGVFVVHDVKVILANDRRFIVMPSRKNPDESYRDIVHPINAQFRGMMEDAVIAAYEAAVAEAQNAEASEAPAPETV